MGISSPLSSPVVKYSSYGCDAYPAISARPLPATKAFVSLGSASWVAGSEGGAGHQPVSLPLFYEAGLPSTLGLRVWVRRSLNLLAVIRRGKAIRFEG